MDKINKWISTIYIGHEIQKCTHKLQNTFWKISNWLDGVKMHLTVKAYVSICFPVLCECHMNELHHQGLAQQRPMEIQCEYII